MNKLNIALVRFLQFCVFVLFTFMVLAYFGTLLLLPLDILTQLIRLLGLVGLPGGIAILLAAPVVGYLGYQIYKIPGLCKVMADIGLELVSIGRIRVKSFDEIVASLSHR